MSYINTTELRREDKIQGKAEKSNFRLLQCMSSCHTHSFTICITIVPRSSSHGQGPTVLSTVQTEQDDFLPQRAA